MLKILIALNLIISTSALACEGTKTKPKVKKPDEFMSR